jgi:3alpha(or 20beta)-hydroxysteroid dehydrogenase
MKGSGRLAGKVAIVTGAAGGLGLAMARRFVDEGARVLVTDITDDVGRDSAASLGPNAAYRRLDVRRASEWAEAVAEAIDRFGALTTLVNNAAILRFAPLVTLTEQDCRDSFETNQLGPFLGIQAVVDPMVAAGGGSIVNISSVDGLQGMPGTSVYGTTKWALRGLTRVAAVELGPLGIRVNGIYPGGMDTTMTMPEGLAEVPLKPLGDHRRLADAPHGRRVGGRRSGRVPRLRRRLVLQRRRDRDGRRRDRRSPAAAPVAPEGARWCWGHGERGSPVPPELAPGGTPHSARTRSSTEVSMMADAGNGASYDRMSPASSHVCCTPSIGSLFGVRSGSKISDTPAS